MWQQWRIQKLVSGGCQGAQRRRHNVTPKTSRGVRNGRVSPCPARVSSPQPTRGSGESWAPPAGFATNVFGTFWASQFTSGGRKYITQWRRLANQIKTRAFRCCRSLTHFLAMWLRSLPLAPKINPDQDVSRCTKFGYPRYIFLPRDAMHKRSLYCRPVSVCQSVTLVKCIVTAEDIVKLLSRSIARHSSFFDPERRYPIRRRTPSTRAQNTRRWENLAIFDWNHRVSRKRYEIVEIGPWLLWIVNRKSYALYRIVTLSLTLTDS